MDTLNYSFTFTHLPPGFKRGRLALIALFDQSKLILSRKYAYPQDIFRLLGGGVEPDEELSRAAVRELKEETGLDLTLNQIKHIASFTYDLFESSSNKRYLFNIELFQADAAGQPLIPSDDINLIKAFTLAETMENNQLFKNLSTDLICPRGQETFRWSDWGTVFYPVHQFVTDVCFSV